MAVLSTHGLRLLTSSAATLCQIDMAAKELCRAEAATLTNSKDLENIAQLKG